MQAFLHHKYFPAVISFLLVTIGITVFLSNTSTDFRQRAASLGVVEAESGTTNQNATVLSDTTASGGKYVTFLPPTFVQKPAPVNCDTLQVPTNTKKIVFFPSADPYQDRSAEIQTALATNLGKDTFCFKAGVYALGAGLQPRPDHTLIGEVDNNGNRLVTLTGAKKIATTDITKDGTDPRWIIRNQSSLGARPQGGKTLTDSCSNSEIGGTYTRCVYADQIFLIDSSGTKRLQAAQSLAALTTGFFYWDYTTNFIYIADDPTDKTVEISWKNGTTSVYAIGGTNWRTSVKNFIIEKFGTSTDNPAVLVIQGGKIEGNLIRYNHGIGLRINGANNIVRNNITTLNGQYGMTGVDMQTGLKYTGNLVENNEISYNNIAWFGWFYSAGGTKFNYTDGIILRNNHVHHNIGFGLWLDAPNINALYEGNLVEDNRGGGIEHEISGNAIMRGNTAIRNGYKKDGTCDMQGWFGGLRAATSNNVEIYNNTAIDNCFGILGVKSDRGSTTLDLNNLYVHDNTISQSNPNAKYVAAIRVYECPTCIVTDYFDVTKKNNRFQNNHYTLPALTGNYFYWYVGPSQEAVNKDFWVLRGNDVTGTFQ